jgi:hypothetical protein
MRYLEGEAWRIICPISIVKKEADWEYTSGVLAQEVYSLYLNIHWSWIRIQYKSIVLEFSILYIVYCAQYTI